MKKKLYPFYTYLLMLALLSTNVWADELHETTQPSQTDEIKKLKIPPQTALDVIKNVKIGIEEDLFIKEDFYTEKSMLEFSNGRTIEDLGGRNNYFVIRELKTPGLITTTFHKKFENQKLAKIVLQFNPPDTSIDELIKTFGPFDEITNPYENDDPRHPRFVDKKTHKYGNMAIHHILKGERSHTDIYTFINGDGSINRIGIDQTEGE